MISKYIANAAVRCRVVGNESWRVSHLVTKKEYQTEPLVVAIIVLFSNEDTIENVELTILKISSGLNRKKISNIIKHLIVSNILVDSKDLKNQTVSKLLEKWDKFGWSASADYYLSSNAFPFVEGTVYQYTQDDKQRMQSYYVSENDLNRSKEYNVDKEEKVPTVSEALLDEGFSKDLSDVLRYNNSTKNTVSKKDVLLIASIAFGKYKSYPIYIDGVADAIKKTSPSGGSRHPTEGYIVVTEDIKDLSRGIYHFSVLKNALELISSDFTNVELEFCFPGLFRIGKPKLIVVLTSLFERNMFRYREPRTFRSIFIDVGHVAENIKVVANALDLFCFSHTYIEFEKVENLLALNPLQEGVIYSMGIC